MDNQQIQNQINALVQAGFSDAEVVDFFKKQSITTTDNDKTFVEGAEEALSEIPKAFSGIPDRIQEGYEEKGIAGGLLRGVQAPLEATAGIARAGFGVVGAGLETLDDATGEVVSDYLNPLVEKVGSTDTAKSIASGFKAIQTATDDQFANGLEVGTFGVGNVAGKTAKANIKNKVSSSIDDVTSAESKAFAGEVAQSTKDFFELGY